MSHSGNHQDLQPEPENRGDLCVEHTPNEMAEHKSLAALEDVVNGVRSGDSIPTWKGSETCPFLWKTE